MEPGRIYPENETAASTSDAKMSIIGSFYVNVDTQSCSIQSQSYQVELKISNVHVSGLSHWKNAQYIERHLLVKIRGCLDKRYLLEILGELGPIERRLEFAKTWAKSMTC